MKLNELFGKSVYNQSEPHIYDKKMVKNSTVHNMVNLGIGHDHVTEGPFSNIAKAGAIAAASLGSDAEASSSSPDTQLKPVERQAQVRETITTSENEKILLTNAKKVGLRGTELAAFMAQAYHETGGFKYLEEQDDGSGKEYFNRYDIEHNPKLAKRLGNLKPGQGFKYRGFGYYQISGLYNYKKLSKDIGYDIYKNPSILKDPQWASVQALWYWRYRVKPNVTDFNDVRKITKLVNGGYNGLAERAELFKSYKMRLNPTVTEGVSIKSQAGLIAYCIVVAESYDNASVYDNSAKKHWIALRDHTVNVLYPKIAKSGIKIEFTAGDPYGADIGAEDVKDQLRFMLYDIAFNKRLKIYTGDSDHPVFTEKENWLFRSVHDYFTHGNLLKNFKSEFNKMYPKFDSSKQPSVEMLRKMLPNVQLSKKGNKGIGFNARGEMNAAAKHLRLATDDAAPALFTEVVGQVCYSRVVGQFPEQKVAILPDFDYKKLGKIDKGTSTYERYVAILSQIKNGSTKIKTTIDGIEEIDISGMFDKQIT